MVTKLWATLAVIGLLAQFTVAHMALGWPYPRGGIMDSSQYDGEVHAFVEYNKKRTLDCNGYTKVGPITPLKAGQVINVQFWGPALGRKYVRSPPPQRIHLNEARHGGGLCQFSLSYDGGKTFHLIGQYSKTCPDVYYPWKVKIPDNAPSCNEKGKCLFVWTWTAVNVPQFYINCADVTIDGVENGQLPSKGILIVDAPGHQHNVMESGDGSDEMGKGPDENEEKQNESGEFSN
ncbi:hypothetical protein BGX28_002952 [Mortierella sp. GBA30]|nr:hypothetical protein BGX28_002952 [Mortierella sp. GBA30]